MNPQEFNAEMERLNIEHRGYYGPEKLKVLWSHLKDVPAIQLRRFVDRAMWADRAPKLGDFISMIAANRPPERSSVSFVDDGPRRPLGDILNANPKLGEMLKLIRGGRKPEVSA